MDTTLLKQAIADGWVVVQKHPKEALYIYNYTAKVQYERLWNEITLACRGLILDAENKIIARPFSKFFNLGEGAEQVLPELPFEVYEKMDGSLGILYFVDDKPFIATRGSFNSEQAIKANDMLYAKYSNTFNKLERNKTYLFEIIYPQNRIVLDYGDAEELVLLAIIETKSGKEFPLEDIGFPIVKKYDGINEMQAIKEMNDDTKEGFVIRFCNNFRVKVKFKEYIRLHRIITQINSKDIWEYLQSGNSLDEILDKVPDEFYNWVKKVETTLSQNYNVIKDKAMADFKVLETPKETALYFLTCTYPAVLFAMLNNKDYSRIIWKMIKPVYEKPFVNMEEA